ncbi:hypothetical protein DJ564_09185 [Pseudomonas sp. 31-12]|nr:hypothetical protein DJ564_09185 [Pseudomonas sp. 31-12]
MGAGLLAKAVVQPASLLNGKPYSRASPLPLGFCGDSQLRRAREGLLFRVATELAPLLLTPHYPPSECQKIAGRQ